ncbi:MAG: amidohydrolase family protein [Candidatus Asgardarchaeia archaeon]
MLIVKDVEEDEEIPLYIVDAHHHIGREKSVKNTPDMSYLFYHRLESLLMEEFSKRSFKELKENYRLIPIKSEISTLSEELLNSNVSWQDAMYGKMVDKTVVFPMNDVYADELVPKFRKSNDVIWRITKKMPDSLRMLGFVRLDPHDSDKAVDELRRGIEELSLYGLKLHPVSQYFVSDIDKPMAIKLVLEAVKLRIPVIFDARFLATAKRIKSLADKIREILGFGEGEYVPGLFLIVAHCGRAFGDPKLFKEILSDPNLYGETSTLSGKDIPLFYRNMRENFQPFFKGSVYMDWFDKILFGTDYPFMGEIQAFEHIRYLFSRDFFDTMDADVSDVQRILGGNILRILSPKINDDVDEVSIEFDENGEFYRGLKDYILGNGYDVEDMMPFVSSDGGKVYRDIIFLSLRKGEERKCLILHNGGHEIGRFKLSIKKNLGFPSEFYLEEFLNEELYKFKL